MYESEELSWSQLSATLNPPPMVTEHSASFNRCYIDIYWKGGNEVSLQPWTTLLLHISSGLEVPSRDELPESMFFGKWRILSKETITVTLTGTKWLGTTATMIPLKAAASWSGQPCNLRAA